MDKPSWINEVKEITREEAELLVSFGTKIRVDFKHSVVGWRKLPDNCPAMTSATSVAQFCCIIGIAPVVFWIHKE